MSSSLFDSDAQSTTKKTISEPSASTLCVILCGAGIGGLAVAIAITKAGCAVTVLEAAAALGEIGAGIQMTPNLARLLIEWGVADVIGNNLVEFQELNMRRRDGTKVGYTRMMPNVQKDLGYPWWLVHRAHLRQGLVDIAREEGAELVINARVNKVDYSGDTVKVTTEAGGSWECNLLIGSDGLNSVVRRSLFPNIRKDPVAKDLIDKLTMEVWMAENAYIITYPISNGNDFNLVLSHHRDQPVDKVEEVNMDELRATYKDFDPRIKRIVGMIPTAQRWPLLVTGPLKSWSNEKKKVVLMGDAAHSRVNHMAQGAATSMEDGAFLGRCLSYVVQGKLGLAEAINIYEKVRMPKAYFKQQVSILNGAMWHLPEGPLADARDAAMSPELRYEHFLKSANLYGDPETVLRTQLIRGFYPYSVYGYDAKEDADISVQRYLDGVEPQDERGISKLYKDKFVGCFLPKEQQPAKTRL